VTAVVGAGDRCPALVGLNCHVDRFTVRGDRRFGLPRGSIRGRPFSIETALNYLFID
jgi:hypothetical protein